MRGVGVALMRGFHRQMLFDHKSSSPARAFVTPHVRASHLDIWLFTSSLFMGESRLANSRYYLRWWPDKTVLKNRNRCRNEKGGCRASTTDDIPFIWTNPGSLTRSLLVWQWSVDLRSATSTEHVTHNAVLFRYQQLLDEASSAEHGLAPEGGRFETFNWNCSWHNLDQSIDLKYCRSFRNSYRGKACCSETPSILESLPRAYLETLVTACHWPESCSFYNLNKTFLIIDSNASCMFEKMSIVCQDRYHEPSARCMEADRSFCPFCSPQGWERKQFRYR